MMAYNGMDKITVDVPLMLRLMEYAREDAIHDKDLHFIAEHLSYPSYWSASSNNLAAASVSLAAASVSLDITISLQDNLQ